MNCCTNNTTDSPRAVATVPRTTHLSGELERIAEEDRKTAKIMHDLKTLMELTK